MKKVDSEVVLQYLDCKIDYHRGCTVSRFANKVTPCTFFFFSFSVIRKALAQYTATAVSMAADALETVDLHRFNHWSITDFPVKRRRKFPARCQSDHLHLPVYCTAANQQFDCPVLVSAFSTCCCTF
jgi:hypothetical protein